MTIAQESWDAAIAAIEDAPSIGLTCHLGPDGDALGSMLALAMALRTQGKHTIASWSEPYSIPRQYEFLPGLELLSPPDRFPAAPELMITFDAGAPERLGTLEPNARAAKMLIVVDHHASNDNFGHINLVDPDIAASAALVFELIERMNITLDGDMATCLYTGLVTDTGRFQYRNTTPAMHRIAAELLSRGVAQDDISRRIYETHPVGYLKLASVVLDRLTLIDDASMVWSWFTQKDLAEHGVEMEDTEGLIDLVRTADVADVAAVLKELPEGRYKVSMRSKGGANIGAVCETFGGGGHALAAGFTSSHDDPHRTIAEIVEAVRRAEAPAAR